MNAGIECLSKNNQHERNAFFEEKDKKNFALYYSFKINVRCKSNETNV